MFPAAETITNGDGQVRRFSDERGVEWVASVAAEQGGDYRGRYYLILHRPEAEDEEPVALTDVRWNSPKTAERTMNTMSSLELRRRLRSARGRARAGAIA